MCRGEAPGPPFGQRGAGVARPVRAQRGGCGAGWNAKEERALPQLHRAMVGVGLAGRGAAHRLPAPPVGAGGGEGLETNLPSFAREMGFSTMITTLLHKS